MRWFYYIFSLFLIWLICSADGCNGGADMAERRTERQIASIKDTIRDVFETEAPGDHLLRAYEETAKQKLIDFADYLKIASDSSVNNVFRTQAAEMAGKIFRSGNNDITSLSRSTSEGEKISVDSLLGISLANRINTYIQPAPVSVFTPLKESNDSLYKGSLSFSPKWFSFKNQDITQTNNKLLVIDIYAVRKVKQFGKERLTVWEVFLGDIKEGK